MGQLMSNTAWSRKKAELNLVYNLLEPVFDWSVLDELTPREKRVLETRYGLEDNVARTYDEVAKEFKVTRKRIRQIEAKALEKLRYPSRLHRFLRLWTSPPKEAD